MAIGIWPQGLTSLAVTIFDRVDGDYDVGIGEVVDGLDVAPLSWLSSHIAQLTALSELSIRTDLECARYFAAQPTLAVLSGMTGLRKLSLDCADMRGVEWSVAPLRALTSLTLSKCAAGDAMLGLAQLTGLRLLALRRCQLQSNLVLAFARNRRQHVAGGSPPLLDFSLDDDVKCIVAVLPKVLESAEQTGLRHIRVPVPTNCAVGVMIEAFNLTWGRYRSCRQVH